MFDIISIGDSVIDTFVPLVDISIEIKDGVEYLMLPYGQKVPVERSVSTIGGNAVNNAIGAARLKLKTAIYTCVGKKDDDDADFRIVSKLKKEGVETSYVHEEGGFVSNHHIVLTFKGERTILDYHQPWLFNLPDLDYAKWIYLTSLSPSYIDSNIMDQVINYLERVGAKLAYQPGTFQLKTGLKKNARLLSLADFFIVNLEEAKTFLGYESGENVSVKKLLKGLVDLGPRQVVITDGGEGSYGFDGENYWKLGVFPAKIVELTGAGDAYATATLAGIFHSESLDEAMRWGAANSASVIEQIGPTAGLLTYHQLQAKLRENSKIVAKDI